MDISSLESKVQNNEHDITNMEANVQHQADSLANLDVEVSDIDTTVGKIKVRFIYLLLSKIMF